MNQITVSRKEFDKNTGGFTRISDDEGNLYMPENIGKRTVTLKRVEGKKLVWNTEGTRKVIIKV